MIYAVTARRADGEELEMVLTCPQFSGQNIYNIEGLGTPRADINTVETATRDGSVFNSALCRERLITIHIKYVDSDFVGNSTCQRAQPIGVCTDSYEDLVDKPSINWVTLEGNKNSDDLGLQDGMDPIPNPTIEGLVSRYWR